MRPPDPSTFVITAPPSSSASASGKPSRARSGTSLNPGSAKTPGQLACALEEVTDGRPPPEPRPVVERPPELVDHRRQEQRRVRDSPRDHDVRIPGQRLHDTLGPEVHVGGDDGLPARRHRGPHLVEPSVGRDDRLAHVIARQDRDRQARTKSARDPRGRLGCALGVRGPHVGDNPDPVPEARRQDGFESFGEQRVEALRRVAQPLLLREGDGAFRQTLEDEVLETALLGEFQGGLDAISRVAGAGPDPDGLHAVPPFLVQTVPVTSG